MLETLPKRSERTPKRQRRTGAIVLLVLFLVLGGMAASGGAYYSWATGASGPKNAVSVQVEPGMTGDEVASLLHDKGVIRSSFAFRLYEKVHGHTSGFTAGVYRLTTNMTVADAFDALASQRPAPLVRTVRLLLPEGLTVKETAARVSAALGGKRQAFLTAAASGRFSLPPYLPQGKKSVEGFLFPDTYDIPAGATPSDVIGRLLSEFEQQARSLPWQNAKKLHVTPYQVVVIASLIEREAKFQSDRVKVARVIYNRLAQGMPLQIDATIEYALPRYKRVLSTADLHIKSPYNTYLHRGLPPTPIASPGRASLLAALEPAKGNWLYYLVTRKDGHESFTASYLQFQQWVAQHPAG